MFEEKLIGLAAVVILGIFAQWIAWRIKLPSILFLLVFGFIAGPVTGFIDPDLLMGELLFPVISLSVALILFEGGLTLKISEFKDIGKVVLSLITVGVLITWLLTTATAYFVLKMDLKLSILLGAVLVVTGPTVIGPLLRFVRPIGRVSNIVKWEGIVIDPVGALLAVLVFEAILAGEFQAAGTVMIFGIIKTIVIGGVTGFVFARLFVLLLEKFWIPDFLQETVALMLVIGAYVLSDHFQSESGLLAVTLMGLALDNQKQVSVKHIVEFKENLRVLVISAIFILLAARLDIEDLYYFKNINTIIFLLILIFITRPVSVFISTIHSDLSLREKLFISWMAPRGIVAAAVSSLFAISLVSLGVPGAEELISYTFIVIIITVTVYGLTAKPVAKLLKVAQSNPQGILFIGAHPWAREIAGVLISRKIKVSMIDTNRVNISKARLSGIPAYNGSVLTEDIIDEVDLDGIGKLFAVTPNDEANSLAVLNFAEVFDREELYQLPPLSQKKGKEEEFSASHLRGRFLFGEGINYNKLDEVFHKGWVVKSAKLSDKYDLNQFRETYSGDVIPLLVINENGDVKIFTKNEELKTEAGQTIVAFVNPASERKIQL